MVISVISVLSIDTHGPSGVGSPDGQFRVDEDWVIAGELGPGHR